MMVSTSNVYRFVRIWGTLALCALCICTSSTGFAQDTDAKEEETPKAASPAPTESKPAPENTKVNHSLQVKELSEKVNDFKEKVFRSKSRLVLLKETVLRGSLSGSKAVLIHRNDMGSAFDLQQAIYSLDGNQIYNKVDKNGNLSDKDRFEIFNGAIVPGTHNVSVMLVYRGNGFGVFSYLDGYKFTIRSSYTFTAEEGKITQVEIVGYEKGNATTTLQDRPDVRYEVELIEDDPSQGASAKR